MTALHRLTQALAGDLGFSMAGSQLPDWVPPKVRPGQQGAASYARTLNPTGTVLVQKDRQTANTSLTTFRTGASTKATIRDFASVSPDLAAAVFTYLRVAFSQDYKVFAYDPQGMFSVDGARAAYALLTRLDSLPDYTTQGFSTTATVRALSEAWGRELLIEGACAGELTLDKGRLPLSIVPISASQIKFYEDGKTVRPVQKVGSDEVDMDIATFFYTSIDQNLLSAYSDSPLEPALQPVIADASFTDSLRKALQRVILPRLSATINYDGVLKLIPPEVRNDPSKLVAALLEMRGLVESTINNLNPEDALVNFEAIKYEYLRGGTGEATALIDSVQQLLNGKMSTGAKTLPSILGHSSGSQNLASSETLMFLKAADGALRRPVNEMLSKMLTLGVRLMGVDAVVKFEYEPIDLRPTNELEAFKAQKQSRILEQHSLGFLSDEETSIHLNGRLPPSTMPKLSGTQYKTAKPDPQNNMYSGTSTGGGGDSAAGNAVKSDAPTNQRAGNKR